MRQVFAADVDRLWDWLRQDVSAKVGQDELFLGRGFGTSIELHAYIAKILELGWALRAGYVNNIHAGFVMVQQDASRNIGMLHVYCAPAFRGQYRELLPYLLGAGRALIPPTMHLGISNHHDPRTMAALLAQYGFVAQTLFIQYGKTGG